MSRTLSAPLRGLRSLTQVFRASPHFTPGFEPSLLSSRVQFPFSYFTQKDGSSPSFGGAGEGNRTLDVSLGSSSFAIKLHLRIIGRAVRKSCLPRNYNAFWVGSEAYLIRFHRSFAQACALCCASASLRLRSRSATLCCSVLPDSVLNGIHGSFYHARESAALLSCD